MSYTDRVWTPEARDELRQTIEQLSADDMRQLLITIASEPDPELVISTLRGVAFGLAARRAEIVKRRTKQI